MPSQRCKDFEFFKGLEGFKGLEVWRVLVNVVKILNFLRVWRVLSLEGFRAGKRQTWTPIRTIDVWPWGACWLQEWP